MYEQMMGVGQMANDNMKFWVTHVQNQRNLRAARRHQLMMDKTAYQRRMNDLKQAGINPLMVGKLGGSQGGPTPMVTQSAGGSSPNPIATAMQVKNQSNLVQAQAENFRSQAEVNSANADLLRSQKTKIDTITPEEVKRLSSQIDLDKSHSARQRKEIELLNKRIKEVQLLLDRLEIENRLWKTGNKLFPETQELLDEVESMKDDFESGANTAVKKAQKVGNKVQEVYQKILKKGAKKFMEPVPGTEKLFKHKTKKKPYYNPNSRLYEWR